MAHEQHYPPGTTTNHEYIHPAKAKAGEPSGYVEKEYVHQEYPKYVDGKLTQNAEEEKQILDAKEASAVEPAL